MCEKPNDRDEGMRGSLNPVVFSLMDDGCPNCAGIDTLPIWDMEPVARVVTSGVQIVLQAVGLVESPGMPAGQT